MYKKEHRPERQKHGIKFGYDWKYLSISNYPQPILFSILPWPALCPERLALAAPLTAGSQLGSTSWRHLQEIRRQEVRVEYLFSSFTLQLWQELWAFTTLVPTSSQWVLEILFPLWFLQIWGVLIASFKLFVSEYLIIPFLLPLPYPHLYMEIVIKSSSFETSGKDCFPVSILSRTAIHWSAI